MALNYLLSPEFQIVNTAGKPATGGYLEVYISGSRERYYCASDFDGTLYPFHVPLDSLGSNVVLADDSHAYDVYVYNRYGGLLMSRYNVHPRSGGGIGINDITSSDGSIIVTQTANGVDLRTNSTPPSILRATAATLYADGQFVFSEAQRDGQNAIVDAQGKVIVNEGWWHYDATVRLRWTGPAQNETQSVSLYTQNASDSMTVDLSFAHSETVQVSGEYKALNDSTQFVLGVTNVPSGMIVELVDFGVHSIIGEGAGGKYEAGEGIVIDEPNRIISVDFDEVQAKLTAGDGITIDNEGVISVDESAVQEIFPVTYDSTTFQEIRTALIAGKLPVMFRNDGADFALQVQRIPLHTFFNVGGSSGSSYAQFWSPYVYTSSSPSLPPYALFAVYSAGYDFETHTTTWSTSYKYISEQSDWAEADATKLTFIKNKPDLSVYATQTDLTNGLATKQDVISDLATIRAGAAAGATAVQDADYVHTDNNFTDADVTKLSGIQAGAEVNVQSNWTEADTTADSYIQNKPTNLVQDASYVHTDNNFTTSLKDKLDGIASGAEVNVRSDWTEADNTADSYIKNKPAETTLAAGSNITITESGSTLTIAATAAPQQQANWTESDSTSVQYIQNKPANLVQDPSYVHTDNNFTNADVSKLAGIAAGAEVNVQSDWTEADNTADSYIQHKPTEKSLVAGDNISISEGADSVTISATSTEQVNADWDATSGVSEILHKPVIPPDNVFIAKYNVTTYQELSAAHAAEKAIFVTGVPSVLSAVIPMTSFVTNPAMVMFSAVIGSDEYSAKIDQGTWSYNNVSIQADWTQTSPISPSYINNKPAIPSGAQLVPSATFADANKVLTVNFFGVPNWAAAPSQVQSDWDATSGMAEILHKPDLSIYAQSADLATVATTGAYSDLSGLPTIPEAQVNSDWSATSGVREILNKPTEKELVAGANITLTESGDTVTISASASATQVNADWDATSGVAEILHKPDLSIYAQSADLATVATSGSYTDLLDKPTIPEQVNADWNATTGKAEILNKPDLSIYAQSANLATVATTGSYNSLTDTPVIPPAQVNSDWDASSGVSQILHKPEETTLTAGENITITESGSTLTISSTSAPQVNADWDATSGVAQILNKPDLSVYAETSDLSSVAFSGSYSDLSNTPDLSIYAQSADLATVATTGSYDDLTDTPTIPAAQVNSDWDATSGVAEILNKPDLVDIVAGPGIVVDNPDGNTLRVSMAADYETVLWDNPNGQSTGQLSLSESPLNFEYVAVYAQARNPTGADGFNNGNFGQFYNRMLSKTLKNQNGFVDYAHMDGNNTTSGFTWYSLTTKWSGASTTTWTWARTELNGHSVNDWYYMLRIVGIHRIANN